MSILRGSRRRAQLQNPRSGSFEVSFADGRSVRTVPPGRDAYEVQAEAFLDAIESGDPGRVFSSYADALKTDRLTRAVVAATGRPG
jgi:predicted dehydrogenase